MLKKLYDKSKIWFAVVWIIAYCVLMSVGDSLSARIGVEKSISLVIALLLSSILIVFLGKNKLFSSCGFCAPKISSNKMIYYIPVFVFLTANFWFGVTLNYSVLETIFYILTMLLVGLLEEVIFRAFLFNAMKVNNVKVAIIVSSLTFGIGHIINLINGSGMDLVSNLLQVVYAVAAGFMFVMIYHKTDSLIVCILAHGIFNSFSVFANQLEGKMTAQIISCVILTVVAGGYAAYIAFTMRKKEN